MNDKSAYIAAILLAAALLTFFNYRIPDAAGRLGDDPVPGAEHPGNVGDPLPGDEPMVPVMREDESIELQTAPKLTFLGVYRLTAYCSCSICRDKWGPRIAVNPTQGRTIAVDPTVIPYGTSVYIEGYGTYIAEDTGGAIKNNRIDVFFNSHTEALKFGVRYADVYLEGNGGG